MEHQPIHHAADPVAARVIADLRRQLDQVGVIADLSAARQAEADVLRRRLDAVLAAWRSEVESLRRRVAELEALAFAGRDVDAESPASPAGGRPEPSRPEASGHDTTAPSSYAALAGEFRERLAERTAAISRRHEERLSAQRLALEEKDEQIRSLTDHLTAARREADEMRQRAAPPPPDPHDLERISGIGPVIAATLRSIGITTLDQVARLGDADLDRIDAQLEVFKGRSRRDGWVEQARRLIGSE
jgi:predicted flap endonuclease-1-like 5' DNA nuclease